MELGFWQIAMRPGKPLMHGRIGDLRVLGLPGNPTSSAVCGVFFWPAGPRSARRPASRRDRTEPARLGAPMRQNGVRQDYVRATLARADNGDWIATPLPDQDSSLVKVLALAGAFIVRPNRRRGGQAGRACRILRI